MRLVELVVSMGEITNFSLNIWKGETTWKHTSVGDDNVACRAIAMQRREMGWYTRAVSRQRLVRHVPAKPRRCPLLDSRFLIMQQLDHNNGKTVFCTWSVSRGYKLDKVEFSHSVRESAEKSQWQLVARVLSFQSFQLLFFALIARSSFTPMQKKCKIIITQACVSIFEDLRL
jgi:hypothetical protein